MSLRALRLAYFVLCALILVGGSQVASYAATYYSVANGNWSSGSTWSTTDNGTGGTAVPTATDAVVIDESHTVTVDTTGAVCASLQLGSSTGGNGAGTLAFNSGTTLTVSGAVTIGESSTRNGSITMASGGTWNVGGAITVNDLGTWTPGAGTVVITATSTLPSAFTTYNNLTTSNNATVALGVGITVNGNLSISDGTTFTAGAYALTVTGTTTVGSGTSGTLSITSATGTKTFTGAVTINNGGAITDTGGATAISVAGNWTNNGGTFTPGADTVSFTGNSAAINGTAAGQTFYGLTVNKTSGQTLSVGGSTTSLTVNGTFTETQGNFTAPATLDMNGNVTLTAGTFTAPGSAGAFTVAGNWSNSATFAPNGGTVTFNGTTAESISGSTSFNNIEIANTTATVTGTANFNVAGTMTVDSGATFSLSAAIIINSSAAAGTLAGSGTIQATRTTATADLVNQYKFTTYTLSSLTVNYAGAGAQTVNATSAVGSYGALQITGGSSYTKTLGGAITVNGALTIAASTTLATGNNQLTLGGNFTNSGTFTGGSSPIVIAGTGTQSIGSFTTTGLVSATNTGTATFTGNVGGAGLTINNPGGTLNLGSALTHTFTGDVTLTAGALNGGSSTLNENSSDATAWNGTGSVFTPGTGTVSFGGGAQTIATATTFNNLTLAGTSVTKTLSAAMVVNGALTINSGITLATGGNQLTLGGNFTNSGTFTAGSSPIVIAGTGTQSIAGFTTTGLVSATNTGTATFTGNVGGAGLTINNQGGTLNLGTSLTHTFTGDVTLTAGALNGGSSTLNENSSDATAWNGTGSVFTPGTGTVSFGGGAQTIATQTTFNNLTLAGTSVTKTLGAAMVVNGALTINSGITLATGGNQLTLGGNFTNSGTFTAGSSAITITGTATQSIAGFTTTGAVSVTKTSATATLGGALSCGTLSIASGGTLATGGYQVTLNGDFSNSGTFTAGASAIIITGAATQSIAGFTTTGLVSMTKSAGTATFQSAVSGAGLTIAGSGSGTLDLGTGLTHTFSGVVTLTSGTLNGDSSTLNENNASTTAWNGTGSLFNAGTGTVNFGAGAQTIATATTFNNLTLSGSYVTKTLAAAMVVNGTLTISSTVTLATGNNQLTLGGNFTNSGTFTPGSSPIVIAGTGAQSIAGFTTTGLVSATNTGTATFTGNVGGAGLTINNPGGTLNLGSGLTHTFTGDVTLTAGTLNGGSSTLSENSSDATAWNGTGTVFAAGTGTVSFGGAAQTISTATTFNNLTIAGSSTKTLGAAMVVNGALAISAGTLATGGNQLTLGGNFTNSGTFTPGSSPIVIAGTGTQSIAAFTTTGLVSATNTGTATFTGNVDGAGLTINNPGGTLNLGTSLTHTFTGDVTLTAGTLNGGTTSTLNVNSSTTTAWNGTGSVFTPGTGTVSFGGGAQTIATATTFNNLTLSGTSVTKTLGAAMVVNGALTINSGITLATANFALTLGGNFANSGTFTAGSSAITITGTATQTIAGFTTTGTVSVTKTGSSTATLTGALNCGTLSIASGGTLSTGNYTITLNGDFVNSGTFTAGSSPIVIAGTVTQSIGGFTTTGLVSATNTGTATFTGNVSGAGLTINNSGGALNLGAGLTHTFSGVVTLTAGTLNGGSSTLNENSVSTTAWNGTGSLFSAGTGTVSFGAAGAQTIATATTFNNLTIAGSGTKTLGAAMVVNGALAISAGTLATGNFQLTLGGNFTNSGTFTGGSSPIVIAGTGAQSIAGFTTTGLVSATNTGTATFTGNVGGAGLTINNQGGTLNLGSALTHTFSGDVTLTAGALNGGSSTLNENSSDATAWNGTGSVFTPGTGTVSFGGGAQTIATATTFNNLTLAGTSVTKTLSAAMVVNGALTINSGITLATGGNQLTLGGNFTNSGTFTAGSSPIVIAGTGTQSIAGFTTTGLVSATNTGTATFAGTVNGAGLTINNTGGTLNLGTSLTHTFTGDVTLTAGTLNGGSSTLNENSSDATAWNGTGSVFTPGTGTVSFGGGAQTIATATTFNNLTLAGTSVTKTLGAAMVVNGALTINSGITLATGGNQLTLGGNFSNSGTFTAGSSAITIAGTATQSIAGFTTTGSVSVTKTSGTATLTGNMSSGALTIGAGGTLAVYSGGSSLTATSVAVSGTLSIPNTATVSVSGLVSGGGAITGPTSGGCNFALYGDWSFSGTINNSSYVSVNISAGSNDQNISGTATFANVTISKAGGTTLNLATALTSSSGYWCVDQGNVAYNAGASTVQAPTGGTGCTGVAGTYPGNLTLSGGAKTLPTGMTAISGNLALTGGSTATTVVALTIGGALNVGDGTTLTAAGFALTVTGTTTVGGGTSGTLTISSSSGTKTFTGDVTVNAGATWNNSGNSAATLSGSLSNSGTFTAGSGVYTLSGASKTISGTIAIPSLTVNGAYTNNGTLTVATALAGSSTLTNASGATLNIGGTSTITGLTATVSGNAVNYTGGAQTVKAVAYYNLSFSGGVKSMATGTSVGGDLNIASGASASVGAGLTLTVYNLSFASVTQVSGTWGYSGAQHNNTTYFANTTGKLSVTGGVATALIITLPGQTFTSGTGNGGSVSGQTAGNPFGIMLTAVDGSNNIDTTYSGAKTVSSYTGPSNAPSGATPSYTTSVTFANGQVAGVATTLVDAQSTTITGTISGLSGVASSSLTVLAAADARLKFTTQPGGGSGAWTQQPVVTVQDAYWNTATTSTASVTLAIGTNPGTPVAGTLTCWYNPVTTLTPPPGLASGVATFQECWIDSAGTGYTLIASSGSLATDTSNPFSIVAPTLVSFGSFTAAPQDGGVLLNWRSGREVNNIGFHVYRDGVRLTSSPVAGSALLAKAGTVLPAGNSYSWFDPKGTSASTYTVEDLDLTGVKATHGPVYVGPAAISARNTSRPASGPVTAGAAATAAASPTLGQVGRAGSGDARWFTASAVARPPVNAPAAASSPAAQQYALAAGQAIKLGVQQAGWYHVDAGQLTAAGMSAYVNPNSLQLFVNGTEQQISVLQQNGLVSGLEFYGMGADTTWTNAQVYWLTWGSNVRVGQRIGSQNAKAQGTAPISFPFTVQWKPRTEYFAALINGDSDNFFGPVVDQADPVTQVLPVTNLAAGAPDNSTLQVKMQGVSAGAHVVDVQLNGNSLGSVTFNDLANDVASFTVSNAALASGATLTLATQGPSDVTLVDTVTLTYPHAYAADGDSLQFTAPPGPQISIAGFSNNQIRVVDVTDPAHAIALAGTVTAQPGGAAYSIAVVPQGEGTRTLLAFTSAQMLQPASLVANQPSSWHMPQAGADMVVVSHADFIASLAPLVALRQAQGLKVAVVDVEDLYDEFNYGAMSPYALKNFLANANTVWTTKPRWALLVGDGTEDPRNYFGTNQADYVPVEMVATALNETASDDWFADFNNVGIPQMAVGRLPVDTASQAAAMVAKIVAYDQAGTAAWKNKALVVAGANDSNNNFENYASAAQALLPGGMAVTKILQSSDPNPAVDFMTAFNSGAGLVDYSGHGSTEDWDGDMLTSDAATGAANGAATPFVISMTCLNGYFQDVWTFALAKALLEAPGGGAVGVWASSGLTNSAPQATLNQTMLQTLYGGGSITVGEAAMAAKKSTTDPDVQRTWILFADPSMRLH